MNTITAQEIKRRGISAVDDALRKGPVHIIKNNKPSYVVLAEENLIFWLRKVIHYLQIEYGNHLKIIKKE